VTDFSEVGYQFAIRTREKVEKVPARNPAIAIQRHVKTLPRGARFTFIAITESKAGRIGKGLHGVVKGPGKFGGIEVTVTYSAKDRDKLEEWSGMTYVTPEGS
jgi:hypothetical protein